MFNTDGLTSLFGRLGKYAANSFMPQEKYEIPQESFMPYPQENDFKIYSSPDGGGESPVLTGGVEKTGGFKIPFPTGGDTLSGGIDLSALTSLLGQNSLGSLLGGTQQQAQQGNVYNQMMPSPMQPQQMLPMMQNTFVPQTQMQNFQPYSLLNGNLG